MPYARLVEAMRTASKARVEEEKAEWRKAAWMSYRANPPTVGEGRVVIPFRDWLCQMDLADAPAPEVVEVSDEEMERLMSQGRMGLFPPGMRG